MISNAISQTLSPVAPVAAAASTGFAINYWYVGAGVAVLLVAVVVVLFMRYRQRNPAGAAKVQATAVADAQAFGLAIVAAADKAVDRLLAARAGATQQASAPGNVSTATVNTADLEPIKPAPAGKNGQAGYLMITLHVDGTPATDVPAINAAVTAAYFS